MSMTSPLENLAGPGKGLTKEPLDIRELQGLIRSGLARLKDAANPANSIEGRFDLVYNAAHALSLAALRWHGYRPSNRYIVFQVIYQYLKSFMSKVSSMHLRKFSMFWPEILQQASLHTRFITPTL